MEPERIDLGPLDVAGDQLAYERLIRRIMVAARPELARRTAETGALALVAGWARPTLAAAAIIAVLAVGALVSTDRGGVVAGGDETTLETLGLPAPAADWMEAGREPSAADLVLAMERRP